jgi:uncharacterized repeat protein (TIGR03803 family)
MIRLLHVLILILLFSALSTSTSTAQDFRIWGATLGDAEDGLGGIFSLRPDDGHLIMPKTFKGNPDGIIPEGLIEGPGGYLFGVNRVGGIKNFGTIFRIKKDGTQYAVIHSFEESDGENPISMLTLGSDNVLYGSTQWGGEFDYGVIFKINPDGTGFQKLYDFDGYTGKLPNGALLHASDGLLYGQTIQGFGNDGGVLFKLQTNGSGFAIVKDFSGIGRITRGTPIEGADGKIYGTSYTTSGSNQAGFLFVINKDGTGFEKLWEFNGGNNGQYPYGYLTIGPDGALYGSTNAGGSTESGMFYRIKNYTSSSRQFEKIANVKSQSKLFFTPDGALVGMYRKGGADITGEIFSIKPDGTAFTSLYTFTQATGALVDHLFRAMDGNYYGCTERGATSNNGVIFKLTPAGAYTKLKDFYTDESSTIAGLAKHSDGRLYGLMEVGGTSGFGGIFRISKLGVFERVYSFTELSVGGGSSPGSILEGSDGALYGLTRYGGKLNQGTVFKVNPDGTNFVKLKDMSDMGGASPQGGLIQISSTELMGTALAGSMSMGMIFKINTNGSGATTVFNFDGTTTGAAPQEIMKGADGFLYGGCVVRGANGIGTLYKVMPDGTQFTVLHNFTGADGSEPRGRLLQVSNGYLFGVAAFSGAEDGGTLFRIKPDGTDSVHC